MNTEEAGIMKKSLFSSLLILLVITLSANVTIPTSAPSLAGEGTGERSWQTKTDTIWPARHYRELDGVATGSQRTNAWIDWKHAEGTVLVYGIHFPTGHVRADALFQAKSGKKVTFGVRVVHPLTGTVVMEYSATSTNTSAAEQRMEIMPDTEMPFDGWYRFELTCPDGVNTLDRLNLLLFQRTSTASITDSEIFMAPSVHLWWSTQVPGAPSGQGYNWTYLEVMYPSEYRRQATYQMAIGTDGIYSGIQMPTRADGSYGHSVLFSVWDNGDVDQDRNLPDYMRSAAVDLGPDAYATRFGGEGTGSSIRYNRDDLWKFDHWVQFLYNVRPDNISVTTPDGKTINYESTLQSMWFKMADEADWRYIGTLRMAGANRLTSGIYSFLENFADMGGNLMRRCYFRNGAMRSVATGEWFALNHAGYGHTQDNGNRYSRYDYGHGVTDLFDNCFYLETGGYMGRRDSADTYAPPQQGQMPWVDTIDIDRLTQRIDLAVTRNKAKTIQTRIEATRTVSDPKTWKLVSFSDEETVGEGDNGRAAFILDGNTSTYYHSQWKNGSVAYPHTFVFEAPEPVTISSIELYQSRDRDYRAKQLAFYISDDGRNWQTVSSKLTIEDGEYPTIQLSEPVTSRFFRLRFTAGYGSNLVINELYFKHDYRLSDLLVLAQQILDEADQFGGYAPEDLQLLRNIYADGSCTDLEALRLAIQDIGEKAFPLTYGIVGKAEHFTPLSVYQIHQAGGRGDLISTEDGALSIAGSNAANVSEVYQQPCSVTEPRCNWLILHSDKYADYYLYNLGTKSYLQVDAEGKPLQFSDTPSPFTISTNSEGFTFKVKGKYLTINASAAAPVTLSSTAGSSATFQLRTNYALRPNEIFVQQLALEAEQAAHEGNNLEYLFQQGLQTYAKAFSVQPQLKSRLVRNAAYMTSNANVSQQEIHDLSKLIDRNINTYYETWYSGIEWPEEMPYIQARVTMPQNAFCFSFTPSQNPQYGQPDIPIDIVVSGAHDTKHFLPFAHLTEGMPENISDTYTSPVIFADSTMRSLRFQVLRTRGERDESRVFAMSEFQIYPVTFDEDTSPYYQNPTVRIAFDQLRHQLQATRTSLVNGTAFAEDSDALRRAIERAEEALLMTDDIHTPLFDNHHIPSSQPVFDLAGRRIHTPSTKGIYLTNGKKHIIK